MIDTKLRDYFTLLEAPRVHKDVALELMVHHLQLAAMYFAAAPRNHAENREEMTRIIVESEARARLVVDRGGVGHLNDRPANPNPAALQAGLAWLDKIDAISKNMETDDAT